MECYCHRHRRNLFSYCLKLNKSIALVYTAVKFNLWYSTCAANHMESALSYIQAVHAPHICHILASENLCKTQSNQLNLSGLSRYMYVNSPMLRYRVAIFLLMFLFAIQNDVPSEKQMVSCYMRRLIFSHFQALLEINDLKTAIHARNK